MCTAAALQQHTRIARVDSGSSLSIEKSAHSLTHHRLMLVTGYSRDSSPGPKPRCGSGSNLSGMIRAQALPSCGSGMDLYASPSSQRAPRPLGHLSSRTSAVAVVSPSIKTTQKYGEEEEDEEEGWVEAPAALGSDDRVNSVYATPHLTAALR